MPPVERGPKQGPAKWDELFVITEGVLPLVPPAACVVLPALTDTHGKSKLEGPSPYTSHFTEK